MIIKLNLSIFNYISAYFWVYWCYCCPCHYVNIWYIFILTVANHWIQHQLCSSWALHICNEVQWTVDCNIRRGWIFSEAKTGIQVGASPQHNGSRIESVMAVCRTWVEPYVRGPVLNYRTWAARQCAMQWVCERLLGVPRLIHPKRASRSDRCVCVCVRCLCGNLEGGEAVKFSLNSLFFAQWLVGRSVGTGAAASVRGRSSWVPTAMRTRRAKEEMPFGNYTEVPPVATGRASPRVSSALAGGQERSGNVELNRRTHSADKPRDGDLDDGWHQLCQTGHIDAELCLFHSSTHFPVAWFSSSQRFDAVLLFISFEVYVDDLNVFHVPFLHRVSTPNQHGTLETCIFVQYPWIHSISYCCSDLPFN